MAEIDWAKIREKLPADKTPEQKEQRRELFKSMDPNGNGFLSLAEVDKGIRDVLALDEVFGIKKVIIRAFNAAKSVHKSTGLGADTIEFVEFRLLLWYLRQYFEIWQMFKRMDESGDNRIDLEEFKQGVEKIESWGVKIDDPEAEFAELDSNGGGQILFNEFADFALKKGLDLEDDDD